MSWIFKCYKSQSTKDPQSTYDYFPFSYDYFRDTKTGENSPYIEAVHKGRNLAIKLTTVEQLNKFARLLGRLSR